MASECVTATAETFAAAEESGLRARSKSSPTVHHESSSSVDTGRTSNGINGAQSMASALSGAGPSSQTVGAGSGSSSFNGSHGLHHARSFDHLSPFHAPLGQSQHGGMERLGAWAATPSFTPAHERQQAISPPANGYHAELPTFSSRERWPEAQAPFDPSHFWPAPFLGNQQSVAPPSQGFAPPDGRQPSPTQTGSPQAPSGPEYSIFVGDLHPGVTEEDLVQQFLNPPAWSSSHPAAIAAAQAQQAQGNFTRQPRIAPAPFTSTKSAKILMDPVTNISRGYGFVRFGDEGDCNRALAEMQGVVIHPSKPGHGAGRPLRVCTATPKEKSASGSAQAGSPVGGSCAPIPGDTMHYAGAPGGFPGGALGITGAQLPYPQAQHPPHEHQQHASHPSLGSMPAFMVGPPPGAFPPRFASSHPGVSAPSPASSPPWPTHQPLHQSLPQGLVSVPYGSGFGTPVRSGTPSNAHAARPFAPILPSGSTSQVPAQKATTPAATATTAAPSGVSLAASFVQALAPVLAEAARASPNSADSASNAAAASDDTNTTVFVGGLSSLISEDTLRTFFSPFGEITYVKIPPGKGCGFVQFVKKADATRAIERMQGFPIGGGRIRLSWGRSQGDKAAAAAALANAQAAQISHFASIAGLGNLTSSQLAQLAGITDVINSAQAATAAATTTTTTPAVHSPAPSEGSSRDLLQAAAGAAWRPPFAMTGEGASLPPLAGAGTTPGPVVSELLAIFARLGIEDNPSLAKKFLDLARGAEAEQMAIYSYTQQVKLHQQAQLMSSAAKALEASEEQQQQGGSVRDELTSGVNWLKSSTFSPFASDDAAAFLGAARSLSSPQQSQQHPSSSGSGQQSSERPISPPGTQASSAGETSASLTRKSSAAQLSSSHHGPVSPPHHIHSHSNLSIRSAAGLTSASD